MFFEIRCIGFTSGRSKVLDFIRSTLASHICSTDSIPWVHHSREEGSLDYNGGFVRLQVHLKFNTNIHRQHTLTSSQLSSPLTTGPLIFETLARTSLPSPRMSSPLLSFTTPQTQCSGQEDHYLRVVTEQISSATASDQELPGP
jgi:hypothetical protein